MSETNREQGLIDQIAMLETQQLKLQSIIDSTVDAIITITTQGIVESFNKAAETMFGYPADFITGQNIKMLMPEPYSSEHDGYLDHYLKTGEQKVIGSGRVVDGQRIDGSVFPIHLSVSEVPDSNPKIFTGIVRDITEWKKADDKFRETLNQLTEKQALLDEEEEMARHVFENITASNNATIPGLASWGEPMMSFSGDLMLSAILPSGVFRVILCDFTGHGLPAAIGAIPVASIHHAMAQKGLPLEALMNELNYKLGALLPTGIFSCIAGIDLDESRTHAYIWNAGLPEVLLVNNEGQIKQRISSNHLPLGVMGYSKEELHCEEIDLERGDAVYLYTDGLTEAENNQGEMFGQQGFEQLLAIKMNEDGRLIDIRNEVGKFVNGAPATDDISLVEIKTLVTTDKITLES